MRDIVEEMEDYIRLRIKKLYPDCETPMSDYMPEPKEHTAYTQGFLDGYRFQTGTIETACDEAWEKSH
jgi:hypothetical protein